MTDDNQSRKISPRSGSFIQELTNRFRLIGRLMTDTRIHPLIKILPVASLAYVIVPLDFPGPIDDALVLWLGTTLFVELCPPNVVEEHLKAMQQRIASDQWQGSTPPTVQHEDIVDGVYYENDPNKTRETTQR